MMLPLDQLTGFRAVEGRARSGDTLLRIETPFSFFNGRPIAFFAQQENDVIHFFDDGETLFSLSVLGFDLNDKRRHRPLKSAADRFHVDLASDGNIHCLARTQVASVGMARMCSTLLSIADWAREAAVLPSDTEWLADEVGLYLRAWKPKAPLIAEVDTVGISGQHHRFDFKLEDDLIDAVIPKTSSSAASLRKMVDVHGRSSRGSASQKFLIILDDRRRPDLAKQEAMILSSVADTWPLSDLIRTSGVESKPMH